MLCAPSYVMSAKKLTMPKQMMTRTALFRSAVDDVVSLPAGVAVPVKRVLGP